MVNPDHLPVIDVLSKQLNKTIQNKEKEWEERDKQWDEHEERLEKNSQKRGINSPFCSLKMPLQNGCFQEHFYQVFKASINSILNFYLKSF